MKEYEQFIIGPDGAGKPDIKPLEKWQRESKPIRPNPQEQKGGKKK